MVKAGKVVRKRGRKRDSEQKGSDDSDTDYMAEEDEVSEGGDDSDFYCSSFEGDEIEENLNVSKVVRSSGKNGSSNKKKIASKISRKRNTVSYNEENDDEDRENNCDDKDDEEFLPYEVDSVGEEEDVPVKRVRVSYKEEEDDEEEEEFNFDDEEKDDEEEFTGEELDSLDEEDDMLVKTRKTNKKVGRRVLQKKGSAKNQKRKRNSKVVKKLSRNNKVIRKSISRKKVKIVDDDGISTKNNHVTRGESRKKNSRRKKRMVNLDSDFASSGSSDNDFTISEEEREQVRKAVRLCNNLTVNLRSSSLSKKIEGNVDIQQQQSKAPVRKGKEKVVDVKNMAVKQVCGICLSEEGKRTVRGTLNCCSHYFCYKCILEWSKVESRCPLCKQRFMTISRPNDLVVQVPECNQIYQPSEEEIRGYIDPYELVICTECHEGGDDSLMLLCDLCDSPAHTYCVGLGQVVPEGNWYCEGCRHVSLASLSSLPQDSVPDQRTTDINLPHNISFMSENRELSSDPNTISLPFPPRYSIGDVIMASPRSGAGASTLSGRRHMHRQIRSFLSSNRTRQVGNLGSGHDNVVRLHEYPSREVGTSHYHQTGALFPPPWGNFRNQVVHEPIPTSEGYTHFDLQSGINLSSGQDQFPQWSRSSNISERNVSPFALEEPTQSYVQKEQVQSIVEIYLKSISGNLGLDCEIVEDIVRKSTHTILATCGLEPRSSELYSLQQQPSPYCSHFERMTDRTTSLLKGHCSTCFDSFSRDIVRIMLNGKLPPFLWVRD